MTDSPDTKPQSFYSYQGSLLALLQESLASSPAERDATPKSETTLLPEREPA
jgi:hypothetical protein